MWHAAATLCVMSVSSTQVDQFYAKRPICLYVVSCFVLSLNISRTCCIRLKLGDFVLYSVMSWPCDEPSRLWQRMQMNHLIIQPYPYLHIPSFQNCLLKALLWASLRFLTSYMYKKILSHFYILCYFLACLTNLLALLACFYTLRILHWRWV